MKINTKIVLQTAASLLAFFFCLGALSTYQLKKSGDLAISGIEGISTDSLQKMGLDAQKYKKELLFQKEEYLKSQVQTAIGFLEKAYEDAMDYETVKKVYKEPLQNAVNTAYSVITSIAAEPGLTIAQKKSKAAAIIKNLRYGPENKDYFWINDSNPTMIMHPYKPQLDGKNLSNSKDPNGKFLFKEFVKVCKENGQGFVDYYWPKYGSDKPQPKLSYVKIYKDWDWIIGSGVYIEAAEEKLKENAIAMIKSLRYGPGQKDYFWINDTRPYMVMHPYKPALEGKDLSQTKDPNGKKLFVKFVNVCNTDGEGVVDYYWPKYGADKPQPKISYVKLFKPWGWIVGTGIYVDDIDGKVDEKKKELSARLNIEASRMHRQIENTKENIRDNFTSVVILLVCFSIGLLVIVLFVTSYFAGKIIVKPIKKVGYRMRDIAEGEGDLTNRLDIITEDEIGELAKSFNLFMDKIQNLVKQIASEMNSLSAATNNLTAIGEDLSGKAGDMRTSSEATEDAAERATVKISSMAAAAEEVSAQVGTVAESTGMAKDNMHEVKGAIGNVSDSVNSVAASIEEMYATLNEVAKNSGRGASVTNDAAGMADNTSEIVNKLGDAAKEIGDVLELIKGIAAQTNLLALNAAIEAAGAGDAGKGFAVVANEVKELARQTSGATEDIRTKVEGMQANTDSAVTAIESIVRVINEINSIMGTIAAAVEEQTATTNEISQSMSTTASSANSVTGYVGETVSLVVTVANNMDEVTTAAGNIARDAAEASGDTNLVKENIVGVNDAAKITQQVAEGINEQAESLVGLTSKLSAILSQFKI